MTLQVFDTLASVFSTCWLIAGSVYVYGAYHHVTYNDEEEESQLLHFCNYGTYVFAFVVITIGYISLVLSLVAAVCSCACRAVDEDDE